MTTPMTGESTRLGHLMIRCPESGEGVPVGRDAASLETSSSEQTVRCPHCGQGHKWSAKDAWVEYAY